MTVMLRPGRNWPDRTVMSGSSPTLDLTPSMYARPITSRENPSVKPRRKKSPPSVTMKDGRPVRTREHRVPPSNRCIEILAQARRISDGNVYVFPGRLADKPISNMVFLMVLRRMKIDVTAHGFRSAFRDWAAERTNFPREVCELALAHANKNKGRKRPYRDTIAHNRKPARRPSRPRATELAEVAAWRLGRRARPGGTGPIRRASAQWAARTEPRLRPRSPGPGSLRK